jgi:hypothetical protein
MKEKIKIPILILAVTVILGLAFYWYEWSPTQVKKECFKKASDLSIETLGEKASIDNFNKAYDFFYKNCLRKKGL